jgi:predicted KAP-like P-loop ATPase
MKLAKVRLMPETVEIIDIILKEYLAYKLNLDLTNAFEIEKARSALISQIVEKYYDSLPPWGVD